MLMRADIRREDGFTLPELLVTLFIALVISAAALSLVEFTMKRASEVDQRVDASQRGRLVMDTMTRELRSQVCVNATTPAMATRTGDITDGNTATFYVDLTDGSATSKPPSNAASKTPELHSLVYNPAARTITERVYTGTWFKQITGTGSSQVTTYVPSYPVVPVSTRRLISNVVPVTPGAPIFTYYKYDTAAQPSPSILLTPPAGGLPATDLATVARVDIAFRTLPTTTLPTVNNVNSAIVLQDEVYVRAADPNDPAPTPTCS